MWTLLSYSKCSNCLALDLLSQPLSKTPMLCGNFSRVFSSATFSSVTVFVWLRMKLQGGSNLESYVAIVSCESFSDSSRATASIVERHVLCASRWICRSVRQQSVAVSNKLVRLKSPYYMRPWNVNKTKDTARPQGWRKHVTDVLKNKYVITGRTDRQTDRVQRNMRPPPTEEGRIINVRSKN